MQTVHRPIDAYHERVPRLWDDTIATHRRAVRDAILDTPWALVNERGLLSVTMTQVAEETGIGRATLYKYFPDVESILLAHHQRHVTGHLERLTSLRDQPGSTDDRLAAVLQEFARIYHHRGRHGTDELFALLHRGEDVVAAQQQVRDLIKGLLREAGRAGTVRTDVTAGELAEYCVHALSAAGDLRSEAAVRRLVAVTLDGLRSGT
jgi:AcrR family transcriptional regulator